MGRQSLLLVLLLQIVVFAAGSGTKADPYTISSVEELVAFRDAVNTGDKSFNGIDMSKGGQGLFFALTKSLDLSSVCGSELGSWEPIGTVEKPFYGHFDGKSYVVDNLYIDESDDLTTTGYGLFGVGKSSATDSVTISNVVIGENSYVHVFGNASAGAVLGLASGNVVLDNCENRGEVYGRENAGGIVGYVENGLSASILNCVNKGRLNGAYGYVGGIVGEINASTFTISKCSNLGFVAGRAFAAGIVGKAYATGTKARISLCKNLADVSSGDRAGGIAFFLKNVTLESVYNSGNVKASDLAAGIVDSSAENVLHYMCVNTGEIFATKLAGGIAAYSSAEQSIFSKCLNLGKINKTFYSGGIVAFARAGNETELKIANSINAGDIFDPDADGPGAFTNSEFGGIVGACWSEVCNLKYNLDLLLVDSVGFPKTEDLLGSIPDEFDDTLWIAEKNLYPQVKSLANNELEEIREASLLAAKPKKRIEGSLGTKSNPLTISSVEELLQFRNAVIDSSDYKGVVLKDAGKGLWFSLTKDIDLKTVAGKGVGSWESIGPFSGNFEGNGHTISNLYVDDSTYGIGGFLGNLFGDKDTLFIQNLKIDSAYIHLQAEQSYIGVVALQAVKGEIVIRNVTVDGLDISVTGREDNENGSNSVVGGILGNTVADEVMLESDTVKGKIVIKGGTSRIGGLMGSAPAKVVLKDNASYVDISAKASSAYIAGIVGEVVSEYNVVGNTNYGNIKVDSLVGYSYIGGIFGVNPNTYAGNVLEDCENNGSIEVSGLEIAVGGIAGMLSGKKDVSVSKLVNSGEISVVGIGDKNSMQVGGIIGLCDVLEAKNLLNKAKITVNNASDPYVGGVCGIIATLSDSLVMDGFGNMGEIVVRNDNKKVEDWTVHAAGLVGDAYAALSIYVKGEGVSSGNVNVLGDAFLKEAFVSATVYAKKETSIRRDKKFTEKAELKIKETDHLVDRVASVVDDGTNDEDVEDGSDDDKKKKESGNEDKKKDDPNSDKKENKGEEKSIALPEYAFDAKTFAYKVQRSLLGWNIEFLREESVSGIKVFDLKGKCVNAKIIRNGKGFSIANVSVNGAYIISIRTKFGIKNIKVD